MPVRPIDTIKPPAKPKGRRREDYELLKVNLIAHARQVCLIQDGLQLADAVKLRRALVKDEHVFACVRSGRNLPPDCKGPAAVLGGYALSEETIALATGIHKTTEQGTNDEP